jgi:hypothetical protein
MQLSFKLSGKKQICRAIVGFIAWYGSWDGAQASKNPMGRRHHVQHHGIDSRERVAQFTFPASPHLVSLMSNALPGEKGKSAWWCISSCGGAYEPVRQWFTLACEDKPTRIRQSERFLQWHTGCSPP